jgi:hypothetical protein
MLTEKRKRELERLAEQTYGRESYYKQTKRRLQEKLSKNLKEKKLLRLKEVSQRYKETKDIIYFQWLKENHLNEWSKPGRTHEIMVAPITDANVLWETFESIKKDSEGGGSRKLQETTLDDMMATYKQDAGTSMPNIAQEQLREYSEDRITDMIVDGIQEGPYLSEETNDA